MSALVRIYGGVDDYPGSRRRFLVDLISWSAPPFVAVEWARDVFERLVVWRPWIEKELCQRWQFLDGAGCRELSLALGWEGDAHVQRFPDVDRLWLEDGYQEANLQHRAEGRADDFLKGLAVGMRHRLIDPCSLTMREFFANTTPPPEPRSTEALIDRVSRKAWAEASAPELHSFDRDERWAAAISERTANLRDEWIAVVVGWVHADPQGNPHRLRGLLSSRGVDVDSVCLASSGASASRGHSITDAS